jgi:DNA-binding Xre family transcriptional regulator
MIVFDKLWETMKDKDVSTYILREKYQIDTRTIRRLKANQNVTTETLSILCKILNCKLSDIAEYIPD